MCVHVWYACAILTRGHMQKVRRQLMGAGFLLLSCGCQGLNTGCQAWQQVPLPAEALGKQPASILALKAIL